MYIAIIWVDIFHKSAQKAGCSRQTKRLLNGLENGRKVLSTIFTGVLYLHPVVTPLLWKLSGFLWIIMWIITYTLDTVIDPLQARSTELSHGPAMPTSFGVMMKGHLIALLYNDLFVPLECRQRLSAIQHLQQTSFTQEFDWCSKRHLLHCVRDPSLRSGSTNFRLETKVVKTHTKRVAIFINHL